MEIPTLMMANLHPSRDRVVIHGVPHVLDLGLVRDVPGHTRRLLDFWVFGMIVNGAIGLQVGHARLRLAVGDYYVLPEGIQHGGLDHALFDAAFLHFVLPSAMVLPIGQEAELEIHGKLPKELNYLDIYRFIERQYRRGTLNAEGLGIQLFAIMEQIAATQHHRRPAAGASSHYLAEVILDLLQNHYREDLTAREISRRLGYSYTHLERSFSRQFGMSIHQRLLRIRIDAAAQGLQMGKSIKEVAAEAGFRDYYYFLKAFKRVRGTTPGTFQRTFHTTVEESGTRAADRLKASTFAVGSSSRQGH